MVDKTSSRARIRNHVFTIRGKPAGGIRTRACLAGIIGGRGGDDDFCAFGDQGFGRVGKVRDVGLRDDAGGGGAGFGAGADAVGAPVVGGGEGAAVVVPEFDDDDVAGYDGVGEGCEASFVRVGAGGAAGDGIVDYGYAGEGVGEVDAPA